MCFSCKKACGGCSWSSKLEPVDGWVSKRVILENDITCEILACPEYEYDGLCNRCIRYRSEIPAYMFSDYCVCYIRPNVDGGCSGFKNKYFDKMLKEDGLDYDFERGVD